ncbi:IS3 family transposase [Streptomyces sp. NPDC001276]|uniref:IS3 family transposase n=1 Tax=Streptomyces sp. NPDC001276 TaxID=3364555 RepID=UPI0036A3AF64
MQDASPDLNALALEEEIRVLDVLHSPEFADMAPAEIYAVLLDRGVYLCSESTMYRLLRRRGEVRERRRQTVHPPRTVPELVAEGPNRVWSWDITELKGPVKGVYYCLYTIIDIFSRYAVAWMIADRENKDLAERFLSETIAKYGIVSGQLTIHSDRGSPMVAQNVAQMMAGLGVTKSHSRPKTSNDNPYSESQYKTLKYRHDFPKRFGSLEDARARCTQFFTWYNEEHRHSGIGLHTPSCTSASSNSSARCVPTSSRRSTRSPPTLIALTGSAGRRTPGRCADGSHLATVGSWRPG